MAEYNQIPLPPVILYPHLPTPVHSRSLKKPQIHKINCDVYSGILFPNSEFILNLATAVKPVDQAIPIKLIPLTTINTTIKRAFLFFISTVHIAP